MPAMTGKQRILMALRGEQPDRTPVFPLAHYYTARFRKITIRDFATDGEKMGAALIAAIPIIIIYLLLGKFFIQGLLAGSVKG